jgi:hypothetical protein
MNREQQKRKMFAAVPEEDMMLFTMTMLGLKIGRMISERTILPRRRLELPPHARILILDTVLRILARTEEEAA